MRPESIEQYIEAMPDGVLVVGPDGLIRFASRQLEELSGYSRAELTGTSVEQLVPEGMRRRHEADRASYHAHPTVRQMGAHLDIHLRRKDGYELPVDIALGFVESGEGVLVVASVRDITDRRRAEEELRRAHEQVDLIIQSIGDYSIFALDPEGRVSSWNPGAARIQGYARDEILGRSFAIFFPPEDVAAGAPGRALAEAEKTGRYEEEGWRVRRDGTRFWASVVITAMRDADGRLRGFSRIARDMTDRKRQEDRVDAMLAVAQAILERRSDDELQHLVAARARSLTGAADAVVVGTDLVRDGEDDDDETGGALMVRAADGPRAVGFEGVPVRVPDELAAAATPRAVDDVAAVLRGPGLETLDGPGLVLPLRTGDQVHGFLVLAGRQAGVAPGAAEIERLAPFVAQASVAMDYARVRRELERMAVYEDRERIGRELHDGAIQSLFAVGMSLQSAAQIAPNANLRERITTAVIRIDEAIRDLRSYIFGLRPGLAADQHLGRALEELADKLERDNGVACAVDIDATVVPQLASRAGDVVQLTREALSNVARHARAATCRVSLYRDQDLAVLEIDDDGVGFVVDDARGQGMGLGNLRDRVAALHGTVELASVPGEGTTVTCRIPLATR